MCFFSKHFCLCCCSRGVIASTLIIRVASDSNFAITYLSILSSLIRHKKPTNALVIYLYTGATDVVISPTRDACQTTGLRLWTNTSVQHPNGFYWRLIFGIVSEQFPGKTPPFWICPAVETESLSLHSRTNLLLTNNFVMFGLATKAQMCSRPLELNKSFRNTLRIKYFNIADTETNLHIPRVPKIYQTPYSRP